MAYKYLKTLPEDAKIIALKADILERLARGYKLLITYKTKVDRAFEWFGSDPAHCELTAYGINQFIELNEETDLVDENIIIEASNWLLSTRDGSGSFVRNPLALDSFGRAP